MPTPSEIILQQLGGNRFVVMTGAKNFVGGSNPVTLSFQIGRGAKDSINAVYIRLDPSDTYTVEFLRLRAGKRVVVSSHSDIYCDALRDLFTRQTGFYTSL